MAKHTALLLGCGTIGAEVARLLVADEVFSGVLISTWRKVIRYFCSSFVALIKLYLLYIGTHNTEKLSLRHLYANG